VPQTHVEDSYKLVEILHRQAHAGPNRRDTENAERERNKRIGGQQQVAAGSTDLPVEG